MYLFKYRITHNEYISNNQLQILYKVVYQQTPPKSEDSLFYMSTDLIWDSAVLCQIVSTKFLV